MGTARSNIASMTSIQLSEWEWPEDPRFLMMHAAVARRRGVFPPTVIKGGEMVRAGQVRPRRGAENH